MRQLGIGLPPRQVIANLGQGTSVTAVAHSASLDTSMGLTPSGGVIMSTRCGDIDPSVLAYVLRVHSYDAARLEDLIDQRSGTLGGVDLLAFTGGIGENDAPTRKFICEGLADLDIPTATARVIPANEEEDIALQTSKVAFRDMN